MYLLISLRKIRVRSNDSDFNPHPRWDLIIASLAKEEVKTPEAWQAALA